MIYFEMSDEQRVIINDAFGTFRENINQFIDAMNDSMESLRDETKPILDRLRELLVDRYQYLSTIKYRPIKVINMNSYIGSNKPRLIHCRNNC